METLNPNFAAELILFIDAIIRPSWVRLDALLFVFLGLGLQFSFLFCLKILVLPPNLQFPNHRNSFVCSAQSVFLSKFDSNHSKDFHLNISVSLSTSVICWLEVLFWRNLPLLVIRVLAEIETVQFNVSHYLVFQAFFSNSRSSINKQSLI